MRAARAPPPLHRLPCIAPFSPVFPHFSRRAAISPTKTIPPPPPPPTPMRALQPRRMQPRDAVRAAPAGTPRTVFVGARAAVDARPAPKTRFANPTRRANPGSIVVAQNHGEICLHPIDGIRGDPQLLTVHHIPPITIRVCFHRHKEGLCRFLWLGTGWLWRNGGRDMAPCFPLCGNTRHADTRKSAKRCLIFLKTCALYSW